MYRVRASFINILLVNNMAGSPLKVAKRRKGNVKVAVRARPTDDDLQLFFDGDQVKLQGIGERRGPKAFAFDKVFDPKSANCEVHEMFGRESLNHAFEGYNACIFAYGQTGSGKSHTMLGSPKDPGLVPQLCEDMFQRISMLNAAVTVRFSFMEIYNEHVRDLLANNSSSPGNTSLRLRDGPRGVYVEGITEQIVRNTDQVLRCLARGAKVRATASTKINEHSSRSHAVISLQIKQVIEKDDLQEEKISLVRLVDLAGSERASQTGATGDRLKEGGNINKSLVTLGRVIHLLAEGGTSVIPYRESVLTRLLQDSLGGNSKTSIIACVNPSVYEQTFATLQYADQAKRITTKAHINHDVLTSADQEQRLKAMEKEVNELREQAGDKVAGLMWFYEEQMALQESRLHQLEAQREQVENHNSQLSEYLSELTNRGINALDGCRNVPYEEVEAVHTRLTADVGAARTDIGEKVSKWRMLVETS